MRKARFAPIALLAFTTVALHVSAQEKPKPENGTTATTLKLQITFSESDGEKKLANLPYTFFIKPGSPSASTPPSWTKLRIGSRVPVTTGKAGEIQYIDVGTNIDARALPADNGRFDVFVNLERSWVEGDASAALKKGATAEETGPTSCSPPIIHQFKTELNLTMHDGESIQTTQAADPISGRLLTITVSMSFVK